MLTQNKFIQPQPDDAFLKTRLSGIFHSPGADTPSFKENPNPNTFSFGRESFSSIIHPLGPAQQLPPPLSQKIYQQDSSKNITTAMPIHKTLNKSSSTKL
jgi:hypothetical protein